MTTLVNKSVSHATLRPTDLIPAFIGALDEAIEAASFLSDSPHNVQYIGTVHDRVGEVERRMEMPGYYESEDCSWDLEFLFDVLNEFAPEGTAFGAHAGDGSDFGFLGSR